MSAKAMVQGLLLRHNSVHNARIDAHWTTSLLFSLIQELVDCYDSSEDKFNGLGQPLCLPPFDTLTISLAVGEASTMVHRYNRFAERIDELGLQGDADAKPILDVGSATDIRRRGVPITLVDPQGRGILSVLGAHKSGQWTGKVLAEV